MAQKLEDVLNSFSSSEYEEQKRLIAEIQDIRKIEKPSSARKRKTKEVQKAKKANTKIEKLMANMSPAEREAFIKSIKGE